MRIVVTGAMSPLGQRLITQLGETHPAAETFGLTLEDVDFTCLEEAVVHFERLRPDVLIHLDVYDPGGDILYECSDKLYQNLTTLLNMFEAAVHSNVKRLLIAAPMSVYPADQRGSLQEADLTRAPLGEEIAPISLAYRLAGTFSKMYKQQSGLSSAVLIHGELYGQDLLSEPVGANPLMDCLLELLEAERAGARTYQLPWSAGDSLELINVRDLSSILIQVMESVCEGAFNAGIGGSIRVEDLAGLLKKATDFSGAITLSGEGDAQLIRVPPAAAPNPRLAPARRLDVSRLHRLLTIEGTPLPLGLRDCVTARQQQKTLLK